MTRLFWIALLLGIMGCGYTRGPEWDRPPRIVSQPDAQFAEKVQYFQTHIVVDATGQVESVQVVGEPRDFKGRSLGHTADAEIIALVKRYKFLPAEKSGLPIRSELTLETNIDYF